MEVRVVTSGYSYPEWRGAFYPPALPAPAMLAFYAEHFSTVEINASYYRMPTAKIVTGWANATPDDFVFTLKAPRRITHDRRLRDIDEPLRVFCDVAQTLGDKLGVLFFQLPPNFAKDADRLAELLVMVNPGQRCAFEFRHPSWFDAEIYALLGTRDAALCVADTERGTTPEVATASWGYLRLRDAEYSDAELDRWIARIRRQPWGQAFVYFKHEETASGPALAARLLRRLTPG